MPLKTQREEPSNEDDKAKDIKVNILLQKIKNKKDYKTKIFLVDFEQQNKYKRMKKRDIHQIVFGERTNRAISRQEIR